MTNVAGELEITGLSFRLNGDIVSTEGDIRLKETTSYTALKMLITRHLRNLS